MKLNEHIVVTKRKVVEGIQLQILKDLCLTRKQLRDPSQVVWLSWLGHGCVSGCLCSNPLCSLKKHLKRNLGILSNPNLLNLTLNDLGILSSQTDIMVL